MDRQKIPVSALKRQRRKPQSRSWRRGAVIVAVVIVAVPVTAACVCMARFTPNAYAPRIIAIVQQETGRTLTINGPIRLQFSSTPTLIASDLILSNPAGFTDPALLTLAQLRVRVALLPLLLHDRLDILDLKLVRPTLYLERNAAGQADWHFHHPRPTKNGAVAAPAGRSHRTVALGAVNLENGLVVLRLSGAAQPTTIELSSLTGKATSWNAPLNLTGQAMIGSTKLTLQGLVGPVAGLTETNQPPWPVNLTFGFSGATATLQGQVAHPSQMSGYDLYLTVGIPALETMTAALPAKWLHGMTLPALHHIQARLRLEDQEGAGPAVRNLVVSAGASDLSGLWPGLDLTSLQISLPTLAGAGTLDAQGTVKQMPLQVQAHWAGLNGFFPSVSMPGDDVLPGAGFAGGLALRLGTATAGLQGGFATPASFSGAAWALTLNIPDLSALSPAWGRALPAWKDIALKTSLVDPAGQGLLDGIGLDGLTVSMDGARFGGQASLILGQKPDLKLSLAIATANLDSLRAAMPEATGDEVLPSPVSSQPLSQSSPSTIALSAQQPTAAALPFGLLRRLDADITLSADNLVYDQANFTIPQFHAVLGNGLLTIPSFTMQSPGGAFLVAGSLDANVEPVAETITLNAPALAAAPLLRAFKLPDLAQAIIQLRLMATARGDTFPAMLGSVSGQLGLAVVNGEVDGAAFGQVLQGVLRVVGVPALLVAAPGMVPVRCAALRLDAEDGTGSLKALAFDSSRLLITGGGNVNFASQTLGMVLEPHLRIDKANIVLPVSINGPFQQLHYSLAGPAARAAAGLAEPITPQGTGEEASGADSLLGRVANTLTGGGAGKEDEADVCGPALELARMGQPGPAPRPMGVQETPPPGGSQVTKGPRDLLKVLLGQ